MLIKGIAISSRVCG